MVSVRFLTVSLLVGKALSQQMCNGFRLNPIISSSIVDCSDLPTPVATTAFLKDKRGTMTTTTGITSSSLPTVTVTATTTTVVSTLTTTSTSTATSTITTTAGPTSTVTVTSTTSSGTTTTTVTSTATSTATVTVSPTTTTTTTTTASTSTTTTTTTTPITTTTTTTTTSSTTSSTSACPTTTYVFQASGTGDFAVDGNFAQLQSAFGSGYRTLFNANRQNAQQFKLGGDDCSTLFTADGNLQSMTGGNANLHYVYFFPSIATASALVNVNWELLVCVINADNTLSCTSMQQSIFQTTQGDPTLEIGDQNYGEVVTINLVPVPGTVFI